MEWHYQSIHDISPHLRSRAVSPVELTRHMLDRIASLDPKLRAYATVTAEIAMEQAEQAEKELASGDWRGPLHGVPIAVKDLCATRGIPTMGGSAVFRDNVPDFDATVVSRLRAAGAILLGKLNLTEGAMGGYHPDLAYPENPWGAGRFPGASSSGSGTAAAAGLAFATLGSDTGGSIRYPAAACGTVGLKPTWGRVSRHGVMDLAASLDHVGPLTRTAADAGAVLAAIAGHDPDDPTSLTAAIPQFDDATGVRGITLGFDARYASEDIPDDYAAAVHTQVELFESLGAIVKPVSMPARLREYLTAWPILCSAEAAAAHRATYPARADDYGPWFRGWLEMGAGTTGAQYAAANELRLQCNGDIARTLESVDALVFPGAARTAHSVTPESMWGPIPDDRDSWHSRFTVPFDYNGYPTLSLPCGLDGNGLPYSVQLSSRPLHEATLVRLGRAFQESTDFHLATPPEWP